MDTLEKLVLQFGPIGCQAHRVTYDVAPEGWPKGVPLCPQCLREWAVKYARPLERMMNPPTLGISVTETVKAKATLK